MSEGETKTIRVRELAVHVAEIGERKVDFVRGNGVASVFEHFESGSARQVVSVTLHAAIIDELAQTPFCLFCFFFFPSHSHPLQQPILCCECCSSAAVLFQILMDCWLIRIKLKWHIWKKAFTVWDFRSWLFLFSNHLSPFHISGLSVH